MSGSQKETYCPTSRADWREWLSNNHRSKPSIWLVYFKSSTNVPSISWSEAVDEALCFGWIDSTKRTIDKDRYMQYFTKTKPTSTWSQVNKLKVAALLRSDLMTNAGKSSIAIARENGSWNVLDDVERLIVPEDLETDLRYMPGASDFFRAQTNSTKKALLQWIALAKRPDTRKNRISIIAKSAGKGLQPKHLR